MNDKVILTGTTGKLGSLVLKHLLKLVPTSSIIVSLYNPSKAPNSYAELGLEVRRGDFEDPGSLDFKGGHVLFLMSYPSIRHQVRVQVSLPEA
jgi:uncharacterized protein YbjT (DUF2867 family)